MIQAVALLVGFYAVMLVTAGAFFVAPFFVLYGLQRSGDHGNIAVLLVAFAVGWITAALLVKGALGARPPRFEAPGKLLARKDAAELFEILETLAKSAGTAPPAEVYLTPLPDLAVTERGGVFGIGSRRVLLIGAPLLAGLSVSELRAGLAHELGHYLGGDTRLGGVVSYTHALFHSVLRSVRRNEGGTSHFAISAGVEMAERVGSGLVRLYARAYARIMHASGRRRELAADALAARLEGRDACIRLLHKSVTRGTLYDAYLGGPVARAVDLDVVPSDLMSGFDAFCAKLRERGKEQELVAMIGAAKTVPFDSHPALTERVRALELLPVGPTDGDERSALGLLADQAGVNEWLVRTTGERLAERRTSRPSVRPLAWSAIARKSYAKMYRRLADKLAVALKPTYPSATTKTALFTAVVRGLSPDGGARIALVLSPRISAAAPPKRAALTRGLIANALTVLFHAALLEQGGVLEPSLGEPCSMQAWRTERIAVGDLVDDAMDTAEGAAALIVWAERLDATDADADAKHLESPTEMA